MSEWENGECVIEGAVGSTFILGPESSDDLQAFTVVPEIEFEDDVIQTILASSLQPQGRLRLQTDLGVLRLFTAGLDETAGETDDGGLTVEVVNPESGREIVLAVPDDGSARYFITRDREGLREAGRVANSRGIVTLARWVSGAHDELGGVGLEMG